MVWKGRRLIPSFIRRRYALKFGIVFLVLGLSIGGLGLAATTLLTENVEATALDERQDAAYQEGIALENWHEQNRNLVAAASHSPAADSDDPDEIDAFLEDVYYDMPEERVNGFYVDTETGEILADIGGADDLETLEFPDADELDGELSTNLVQRTDPYETPDRQGLDTDTRPVVSYYVGVNGGDGALVFTFDLADRSMEMVSAADSGTTLTIVDEDGRIVSDDSFLGSDGDEEAQSFLREYEDPNGVLETAQSNARGAIRVDDPPGALLQNEPYNFDPDGYVVGYYTTNEDWTVLVHTTESDALGFANSATQFGLLITFVGVALIGVFGAILGRSTARSLIDLSDRATAIRDGEYDTTVESDRIDEIGVLYDSFDDMRGSLVDQIDEAETAREEAERERERIAEINDHLERQADEYSDVMGAAADGDLTARMDADSGNEAMAEIATDFNVMLEEIEETVAELNQFATDVATASEQVTASSEEVRSASQQVTESIQEISDGAERQNESLQSVNQEMSALSTTTEEIAASSNEVADIAERTVDTGQEGQEAAQEAMTAMDEIETEAGGAVEEIQRLEDEVQQIDELIATISEIARQTNMLALNANIEASRSVSGDDEEGFSVVAKEVKALSEDVAEAADEAEDRLEAIRERTEQSAAEVEGTSSDIEDASERVQEAVDALEEIATLAQETNVGVQEISAATEQQAASTQEVVAMVDDAATVSEETTSEAENVAAAAEEQTTALTEVTNSASNLSEQSAQLSAALDRFETDVERTELELDVAVDTADSELSFDESAFGDEPAADDASDDSGSDRGITFESEPDADAVTESDSTTLKTDADATADAETVDQDTVESDAAELDIGTGTGTGTGTGSGFEAEFDDGSATDADTGNGDETPFDTEPVSETETDATGAVTETDSEPAVDVGYSASGESEDSGVPTDSGEFDDPANSTTEPEPLGTGETDPLADAGSDETSTADDGSADPLAMGGDVADDDDSPSVDAAADGVATGGTDAGDDTNDDGDPMAFDVETELDVDVETDVDAETDRAGSGVESGIESEFETTDDSADGGTSAGADPLGPVGGGDDGDDAATEPVDDEDEFSIDGAVDDGSDDSDAGADSDNSDDPDADSDDVFTFGNAADDE